MKRFKNWIHGSLWAGHFRPGALCSGEGCVDRRWGQKFDKENSTALCTGIYTCTSERYRESKLAFPAYKRSRSASDLLGEQGVLFLIRRAAADGTGRNRKKSGK